MPAKAAAAAAASSHHPAALPPTQCTSASGPLCEEELALTAELFPELSHELGLPPAPPLQQLSTDPPGVRAAKRERSACAQPDRDGRAPSPALAAQQQQQQQHSSAEFNQSHAPTVQTSAPAIAARADSLAQARVHIQLALPPARVVLHGKVPAHPLQHPTITTGAAGYHGASPSKRCRHWHKHPPLPGPAN